MSSKHTETVSYDMSEQDAYNQMFLCPHVGIKLSKWGLELKSTNLLGRIIFSVLSC